MTAAIRIYPRDCKYCDWWEAFREDVQRGHHKELGHNIACCGPNAGDDDAGPRATATDRR